MIARALKAGKVSSFDQQAEQQRRVATPATFKRRSGKGKPCNLYFRDAQLIEAYGEASRKKLIQTRSISSAVEKRVRAELKRTACKLKDAGIKVPD